MAGLRCRARDVVRVLGASLWSTFSLRLGSPRRARAVVATWAGLSLAAVLACGLAPGEYEARALVGRVDGEAWVGPASRLRERVLAREALEEVARAAAPTRADDEAGALEAALGLLVGLPADPLARLAASVEVLRAPAGGVDCLAARARATTPAGACAAADALAARLVALGAAAPGEPARAAPAPHGAAAPAAPVAGEAPAAAPATLRAELAALRARWPGLRDAGLEGRGRALAEALDLERAELTTLEARVEGLAGEATRLRRLVEQEALAVRAARQVEAALAREGPARPEGPPAGGLGPRADGAEDVTGDGRARLRALEAELAQLRGSYTDMHPAVRRAQRLVEAERRRLLEDAPTGEAAPAPVTTPPPLRTARRPIGAAGEADGALPIAEDPEPAPAGEALEAWLPQAPSYGRWVEARAKEEAARVDLAARDRGLEARDQQLDRLRAEVSALAGPRVEEARLEAALEAARAAEQDRRAATSPPVAAAASLPRPDLAVVEPARVVAAASPWRLLPWALALALVAPLGGAWLQRLLDPTVRAAQDLDAMGLRVLGEVPPLRARGRRA